MRIFYLAVVVLVVASVCVDAAKVKKAKPPANCKRLQKQCDKGKTNACRKVQRLCQGNDRPQNRPNRPTANKKPAGMSDCPTSCAGVERIKVCGTNGRTYPNECLLRKERCRLNSDLDIAYAGKCGRNPRPASQTAGGGAGGGSSSSSEEEEEDSGPVMQEEQEEPEEEEEPEEPEESEGTEMEQSDGEQPEQSDAEEPEQSDTEQPGQSDTEQPEQSDSEQPEQSDPEQPEQSDTEQPGQSDAVVGGSEQWDGVLSIPGLP